MKYKIISTLCLIASSLVFTSCSNRNNNETLSAEQAITTTAVTSLSDTENTTIAESSIFTDEKISEIELISYNGNSVVDKTDFEFFEKYFYGVWFDEKGIAPNNIEMCYSGDTFNVGFYRLVDIYVESDRAYLVIDISGETTIYTIDTNTPETMYEYYETNHGGRNRAEPDFIYKKTEVIDDGSLGFFGILKLYYVNKIPNEILMGNTLQTGDGVNWVNHGEKISIVEESENAITFKALCRAEGDNPYIVGSADSPMESVEIIYTAARLEDIWKITECDYA